MGNSPSPPHNREVLASVLHGIEDVGEVPSGVRGADLWHKLKLSDVTYNAHQGVKGGKQSKMSADEVDRYLSGIEEPKRSTLKKLRASILKAIPDAEEGISYGMPAFRVDGKVVAGFAAFKNHLTYVPHSGSVFEELGDDLVGYSMSKSALRFPIDEPLPDALVERLVAVRLRQIAARG